MGFHPAATGHSGGLLPDKCGNSTTDGHRAGHAVTWPKYCRYGVKLYPIN